MKKTIYVFAAIFSFAVLFTACKETKKEEAKEDVKIESHEGHNHDSEGMASTDVYQCPMNCEKGKTYDKEGSCPVCKMDLKMKTTKDKKEMNHATNCKCKEGGECTCEDGKCQCEKEVVLINNKGTMCGSGGCSCNA